MPANTVRVQQIDHVELVVPDRQQAAEWYQQVLGLEIVPELQSWAADPEGPLMISGDGGKTKLALFQSQPENDPGMAGFRRLAFRVDAASFRRFLDHLSQVPVYDDQGRPVSAEDVVDHQHALSLYFCDPYGHHLEIITYERAKALGEETAAPTASPALAATQVIIYTDGGSLGNPGPGGYAAVLLHKGHRKELSGGFRLTTNNRMELMAAIKGLEALKRPCSVTLYTDSRYLVDAMSKGWARRWRANGWRRSKREKALNPDLWERLLDLCDQHDVKFVWLRGHAGDPENERCDQLSQQAARQENLPPDPGYEASRGQAEPPSTA